MYENEQPATPGETRAMGQLAGNEAGAELKVTVPVGVLGVPASLSVTLTAHVVDSGIVELMVEGKQETETEVLLRVGIRDVLPVLDK